jgi:hypothetical protein
MAQHTAKSQHGPTFRQHDHEISEGILRIADDNDLHQETSPIVSEPYRVCCDKYIKYSFCSCEGGGGY